MEVTIRKEKKEILVHTVSLHKNNEDLENMYLFRCPYCSSPVVNIQGLVGKIMPGLEPTDDVVVVHECRTCKRLYTFQTLMYLNKKETKVALVGIKDDVTPYYCHICRNPVLQFRGDKVIKLPNFELIHLPARVACSNPLCTMIYYVVDVI